MTLLVDGDNVMGSRPDGWWRDRVAARRRLAEAMDEHAVRTGESLRVVFDGPAGDARTERVEIRHAPHADDLLAELAGPGITLVTSDRGLRRRAEAAGAEVIGAGAFRRRLGI